MYFKSLELYGFKSFADRTKIVFEPGITAIVGPNGCGKSNILDSIKWVLGEQSAKDLRGSRMEDVIFNGTDTKEPVGFAEVTLELSNHSRFLPIEYDVVLITRRLYRSGESEYLINKNPVRLKDINELLMGTGIGTSAYSIVEQGKIDMIISSKPDERRLVFEEVSGIVKYKSKKKETMRRLEATENNLLRVNDIIEEVKRQINSIDRQARKAQRYSELYEQLKSKEIKIAQYEIKKLNHQRQLDEKDFAELSEKSSEHQAKLSELGDRLSLLENEINSLDVKISEIKITNGEISSNIQIKSDKIKMNNDRLHELDGRKGEIIIEKENLFLRISEIEAVLTQLRNEFENISTDRKQRQDDLDRKQLCFQDLECKIKESEGLIKSSKTKIVDIIARQTNLKNELVRLSSDMSNYIARSRRLKVEYEKVVQESDAVRQRLERITNELSDFENSYNTEVRKKETFTQRLKQKQGLVAKAELELKELISERIKLYSKLQLLKDIVTQYEGFAEGPRAIFKAKDEGRLAGINILGSIADLIEVERGYESAVEAVLADALQYIIVEDPESALRLYEYIKANDIGKSTIISLHIIDSIIQSRPLKQPLMSDVNLSLLLSKIRTNERLKGFIDFIVGEAYVTTDLMRYIKDRSFLFRDIKVVTKDGEFYHLGKFIVGRQTYKTEFGLLNRKTYIRELEHKLMELLKKEDRLLLSRRATVQEIEHLQKGLNSVEGVLKSLELDIANKKSQKDSIESEWKKIEEESSIVLLESQEIEEEIGRLKTRKAELKERLEDLDREHTSTQLSIEQAQKLIEASSLEKERLLVEITKIRTELDNVSQRFGELEQNIKFQESLLSDQKEHLNQREVELQEILNKKSTLASEIFELGGAIEELKDKKQKVCAELNSLQDRLGCLEKERDSLHSQIDSIQYELGIFKDKLHQAQMRLQEGQYKIEAIKSRIEQSYKIALSQISEIDLEVLEDISQIQTEAQELKEKIERMGAVNLVALEEKKELEDRYNFLTKQREDLLNAKESLLEVIRKINRTSKGLFLDTFDKVRQEFKEYFRYLFGGGQAELVLMDENDVLECGIEIMARPPGKKLQSISLLSGGEKALTAISLLFAIFKVKPSPFCILDEVDAPLDESNIERFSSVLADFAKVSQFIVITHNKRTITNSDVMYGITMEQSGISKVVSVKLKSDRENQLSPQSAKSLS